MASCISTTTSAEIDGQDEDLLGSVRLSVPLGERERLEDWEMGLRLQLDTWQGGFDQTVPLGTTLQVGDTSFMRGSGPVAIDFEHDFVGAGMYASRWRNQLEWEVSAGLGGSMLDIDAALLGVSDSDSINSLGGFLGGRAAFHFAERWAAYYELFAFRGRGDDKTEIYSSQIGVTYADSSGFGVSAGVQDADYTARRDNPLSDLQLGLGGLFVRLEFHPGR